LETGVRGPALMLITRAFCMPTDALSTNGARSSDARVKISTAMSRAASARVNSRTYTFMPPVSLPPRRATGDVCMESMAIRFSGVITVSPHSTASTYCLRAAVRIRFYGVAETVGIIGVPFSSSIKVGVSVGVSVGKRVGIGACVGVASSVLAGKLSVGTVVGITYVGCATVGIWRTTVAGGGVASSVGRAIKLTNAKLYKQSETSKIIPAQPAAH
jgi:hypothetical protein